MRSYDSDTNTGSSASPSLPTKPNSDTTKGNKLTGNMCLYCTDNKATIACEHDTVRGQEAVYLCRPCHETTWEGQCVEVKL